MPKANLLILKLIIYNLLKFMEYLSSLYSISFDYQLFIIKTNNSIIIGSFSCH